MNYFNALLTSKAHKLYLPEKSRDNIQRVIQSHQRGASSRPERAPFRRQLDFWALAFATAVARGVEPLETSPNVGGYSFVDTRSVEMPDGLCELLAVVAFSVLGVDDDGVQEPNRIIDIANRYAAVGCDELLGRLYSKGLRLSELEKAIDFSKELLADVEDAYPPVVN